MGLSAALRSARDLRPGQSSHRELRTLAITAWAGHGNGPLSRPRSMGTGRPAVSGSRFVTVRPSAGRSCREKDPGTWGSGCESRFPRPRARARRAGKPLSGQRREGGVRVAHSVPGGERSRTQTRAVAWTRLRPCRSRRDRHCVRPATGTSVRGRHSPRQSRSGRRVLSFRASPAAGEASEG